MEKRKKINNFELSIGRKIEMNVHISNEKLRFQHNNIDIKDKSLVRIKSDRTNQRITSISHWFVDPPCR